LLTLLLLPPVIFATRRLASSVLSSLSWVRRSCLFLRSVSVSVSPAQRNRKKVDSLGLELESADLGRRRRHLAAAVSAVETRRGQEEEMVTQTHSEYGLDGWKGHHSDV
jgi:hypothetical protein